MYGQDWKINITPYLYGLVSTPFLAPINRLGRCQLLPSWAIISTSTWDLFSLLALALSMYFGRIDTSCQLFLANERLTKWLKWYRTNWYGPEACWILIRFLCGRVMNSLLPEFTCCPCIFQVVQISWYSQPLPLPSGALKINDLVTNWRPNNIARLYEEPSGRSWLVYVTVADVLSYPSQVVQKRIQKNPCTCSSRNTKHRSWYICYQKIARTRPPPIAEPAAHQSHLVSSDEALKLRCCLPAPKPTPPTAECANWNEVG